MREIKFRAWDGKEIYENVVIVDGRAFKNEKFAGKPMQYTGLNDKNGREIYEGDILTDHGDEGPLYIEYSKEHAAFVFVDKFDSFGTTFYTTTEISYEGFEVIGNIQENPELLEVAE